ncbi:MAG: YlmC/YmxH family sporulation protein [Christensenellales bacterium]
METTFTELRSKEVINALTGKMLGNICDIVLDLRCNRILGFVVPGCKNFFNIFKPSQEIFIPFSQVCRIGEDIILVEVAEPPSKKQKNKPVRIFEVQNQQGSNEGDGTIYERKGTDSTTERNNEDQSASSLRKEERGGELNRGLRDYNNQSGEYLQNSSDRYNSSSRDYSQKTNYQQPTQKYNANAYSRSAQPNFDSENGPYLTKFDQNDIYPIS